MPILHRHRIDPALTPEQREARIAELRQRRRARLRWLAWRSAIALGALLLVAAGLAYWLLMTLGGREFLLAQIVARLPAGTSLEWREAEGPAAGPLTLYDVRFRHRTCPDRDGEPVAFGDCDAPRTLSFEAARVMLDPDIRPLLGRLLRLDVLEVEDAVLTLPPAAEDEPFELPRWPESLPQIGPLPLALEADAIRVERLRVVGADGPLVDIASVRGGFDVRDGLLRLERLRVESDRGRFALHGEYAPRDDYRMDLTGSALLPAPPGRTRPRFGLAARGDVARLDVAVVGHAPAPLRAVLTLRGRDQPGWRLRAGSEALDPALLAGSGEPGIPVAFALEADGRGGEAVLEGSFSRGDFSAVLLPSTLRLDEQVLELDPLVLQLLDGTLALRGRADFRDAANPVGRFSVAARGLRWAGTAAADGTPAPAVTADADLGIAGRMAAWAVIGHAELARDGVQARLELDGRGNADAVDLRRLHAQTPGGALEASGRFAWAPALAWNLEAALEDFDPGYFLPDWNGAIDGRLTSEGGTRADDGGLDVEVVAERLGGRLRGRTLRGQGRFAMRGPAAAAGDQGRSDYEGELDLSLGSSRVEATGSVTDRLRIDATLAPLQLADLLPGGSGRIEGEVRLSGARDAPDADVDLRATDLAWGAYRAEAATLAGRMPWQRGQQGSLALQARGLQVGVALDTLAVRASGAVESLRAEASARGAIGALDLAGSLERRGETWQGRLASLRLAPERGAAWSLQDAAAIGLGGGAWRISESCFASSDGGSLCVQADWPRTGVSVTGRQLPLALAAPYLPEREPGRPWVLRGEIALDGRLRPAGDAYSGDLSVRSESGGVRVAARARRDVIGYEALRLDLEFDPQAIRGTLAATLGDGGRVQAQATTGWDAYSPLSAELTLDTDELLWLELFSPDIVEPEGRLSARISVAGTRAEPQLGGQAQLSQFATTIPSLAIELTDGNLRLDAAGDGSARISGSVRSGEGTLDVGGSLGWRGAETPLELNLRGRNLLVSDTRDLRAVVDPDVVVRYGAGRPLEVVGTVVVSEARIDLERLDDGVSVSPDVVVLDPVDPDAGPPLALRLDLTLVMGDAVTLNGFGLEGTLDGRLRVRQSPGRDMLATGALQVGGRYEAYGQELEIVRGNLVWSNDVVSDPLLDIRAQRRIEAEELTAGIDVTGRASAPQATVWTDPARDQSEALAYLALGRSLSSVTGDEGRQLDAASAALSAGGGLVASQLGSRIGLDDAGVSHSRALGGSVLGVGKQLSPRLYVGFGVSLLGTGQVLTLKYLLGRGFDIEIESSTVESRGSLNWRRETD
ncbi:translocation/assembly module TamB domain-containing protein [Luteimonas sp. RD2P54]|uniref:Translocation/assembly module TamB domain-containing protein n=1 Tax=Luteimonas endophytica TaxID=3042023 RepID=A0ABT6J5F8_9GAMM|nr:translocation/assembly module TamB domain-containing protein [Luteimonas endophytica]MDH5822062.1 translocation/assembly module TamB domain-containing protein [Luteimonas endophytica]